MHFSPLGLCLLFYAISEFELRAGNREESRILTQVYFVQKMFLLLMHCKKAEWFKFIYLDFFCSKFMLVDLFMCLVNRVKPLKK